MLTNREEFDNKYGYHTATPMMQQYLNINFIKTYKFNLYISSLLCTLYYLYVIAEIYRFHLYNH